MLPFVVAAEVPRGSSLTSPFSGTLSNSWAPILFPAGATTLRWILEDVGVPPGTFPPLLAYSSGGTGSRDAGPPTGTLAELLLPPGKGRERAPPSTHSSTPNWHCSSRGPREAALPRRCMFLGEPLAL